MTDIMSDFKAAVDTLTRIKGAAPICRLTAVAAVAAYHEQATGEKLTPERLKAEPRLKLYFGTIAMGMATSLEHYEEKNQCVGDTELTPMRIMFGSFVLKRGSEVSRLIKLTECVDDGLPEMESADEDILAEETEDA